MNRKAIRTVMIAALALGSLSWSTEGLARRWYRSSNMVPAGTAVAVRVDSKISTDDNHNGDAWSGTISQPVSYQGHVVIPEGSRVSGVVTSSVEGTHDSKAQLDLEVREVSIAGRSYGMTATTPTIVAGSKRAKKLGVIAGGAAAGALVGNAVGKGKGALIGGVLGGAATYGLTRHAFRTLQVKPGTEITFTTREEMVASR